jgi:hypothetical protein
MSTLSQKSQILYRAWNDHERPKPCPPYSSASYSSELLSEVMLEIMSTSYPYKQNFTTWNIKENK